MLIFVPNLALCTLIELAKSSQPLVGWCTPRLLLQNLLRTLINPLSTNSSTIVKNSYL